MAQAGEGITPAGLARRIVQARVPGQTLLVGITGPVAVGKTTLAGQIASALAASHRVEIVSTDGFLRPNAELDAAGLTMRKGFPESYDRTRLDATLAALRRLGQDAPVAVPAYSHTRYDVDPAAARMVSAADIVLVEGLGLGPDAAGKRPPLDLLIYVDADDVDVRGWFMARFMALWAAGRSDPASFYARFAHMNEQEAHAFGNSVWDGINRPNWLDHIAHARPLADVVVKKGAGHALVQA
jgi:type I pantothenate kinase